MIKKLLIASSLLYGVQLKSQALVNKLSETITGQTDTVPLAPILKTANSSYVVSANQKVNSTQNDFKTTWLNGNIATVAQQLYNASTKKAFTTVTTSDALGNVYVAGSTYINGANGQDLTVMKYNSAGVQQWVKHYNGPGNNYDIASGIVVDNAGNVYVTGASVGLFFALVDYVTLKFNSGGTQQWATRYNFSNGIDIPAGITLDNTGNVIVSGSSSSSSINNNWDFATVKYNSTTGVQMQVQRQANTGNAQDKLIAQTKDNSGNIYTTGITSSNGINFDVQTIKYDQNMNLIWTQTFDGYGNFDQGTDIAVDNSGNVIITGYATRTNLSKELLVLSYSPTGALNWKSLKQPQFNSSNAEGIKVKIKNNNEIFIGGNFTIAGNQDIAILRFDNLGIQNLEKTYNGASNLKDQLLDILIDGNFIIVSGTTNNGTIDQNTTIRYEYKDFSATVATTTLGINYEANKIIIYFNKPSLKMNVINNRDFLFGRLSDFVQDSTCNKINTLINSNLKCQNFSTRKIFYDLTEADSLSLSRQGDYVKIPPFYGALIIETPSIFNVEFASDTLYSIKPDINYAVLNRLYPFTFTPNDPRYVSNFQSSLASTTTFPNADINCTAAWNFTKGQPYIKVGIYDTGVNYNNTDLSGVVAGGYDYYNNIGINGVDNTGHGTSCAGIIGAKTNNNIGVAGIAGGDIATSQSGVSIYDMKIATQNTLFVSNQTIGQAIIAGANSNGLALNVMNNSYGDDVNTNDRFLIDGINFANRNGVLFCAASGNSGLNSLAMPAGLKEQTILSVGSTGNNGHFQNPSNGDPYTPNHGNGLDMVAPGTSLLIYTTKSGVNFYGNFNGTSAATPHAAGAGALLMSYLNQPTPNWNNLTHEDCESILKKSCTDLSGFYGETVGYDQLTGHGRINAGNALSLIETPKYKIRHIDQSHFVSSSSKQVNTVVSNQQKYFEGDGVIATGNYIVDIFETITTLNYSIGANEQVLGSWPLYKASTGTSYYNPVITTTEPWYCEVISANNSQAILRTYTCLIKYNLLAQLINYTYPMNANNVNSAFSLYTYDPTAIGVKENQIEISTFNIYPNPSNGNFTIGLHSNSSSNSNLIVTDIVGTTVLANNNLKIQEGANTFNLSLNNLKSGIYFVTLNNSNTKSITKKIIIK